MIVQPQDMKFDNKKFSMIISGSPGIGKTTLALSAPNPILIDFDRGISRVSARHRKMTDMVDTYEELLEDMKTEAFSRADTVVIDTGGSFVTYLQDWAMRQNPANQQKGGGISLKGYGAVKAEFNRFTNHLKDVMNKNIIYIFHTVEEKDKDGSLIQRLLCEGSARNTVWQPCDLGCFMYMAGNGRKLGFSPTESYFAKGCFGISGVYDVPTLDDTKPNDFITKLFDKAKANIAAESEFFEAERTKYESVMKDAIEIIGKVNDADSARLASQSIEKINHVLTSEAEIKALFREKLNEIGVKWNKKTMRYESVQAEEAE